jgi:hypothetical protein
MRKQPEGPKPAKAPQLYWVIDIIVKARAADCAIWCKENLLGIPNDDDSPGMILPQEMPRKFLERLNSDDKEIVSDLPKREAAE